MQIKKLHDRTPIESNDQQQNAFILQKNRPHLIKKRKIPSSIIFPHIGLKHVVNIGDICFLNEEALRNPDTTDETLLKSLYQYNMISKVTLNKNLVNIEVKKNYGNFLPPQYFIERLRSFGDKKMANIAFHLENIHHQFSMIKEGCPSKEKSFCRKNQEDLLKNFLASMQGKKYFLYFSEISPEKITMKNIVFSVSLLEALGCNIKNVGLDFLRYKHVFFEVFTAKNYGNFMQKCFQKFSQFQGQMMENPDMPIEERIQMSKIVYSDEVIRKKYQKDIQYEESVPAKVIWYSPHPSICVFEIIDINETEYSMISKKVKFNEIPQSQPEQELKFLKKLGNDYSMLLPDSDKTQNDHLFDLRLQIPEAVSPKLSQKCRSPFKDNTEQTHVGKE